MSRALLVTRAPEQGERTLRRFTAAGWDAAHVPCIELGPPPDPAAFATAAAASGTYDWVVLTSQNAVARLHAVAPTVSRPIAAIGPETSRAVLELFGRPADLVPRAHHGEALAAELLAALGSSPRRVVLYRAARGRDVLPNALRAAGHSLDVVVAYAVRAAESQQEALAAWLRAHAADRQPAVVTLASSLTVDSFLELAGAAGLDAAWLATHFRFACISPLTAQTLAARGIEPAVTAEIHTMDGLFQALSALGGDVN